MTNFTWGINVHGNYSLSIAQQLSVAESMGLTSLRIDVTDASAGTISYLSSLITQATAAGITIDPVIVGPPAASATSQSAAYAWGVATGSALASAFPSLTWEVGNELDTTAIKSGATGQSPSDYNDSLYSIALGTISGLSAGIHQADPKAKIAVGIAGIDYGFLQRLAGDGVSWDVTDDNIYVGAGVSGSDIMAGAQSLFASLASFGKPIVLTEVNQAGGSLLSQTSEASTLVSVMGAVATFAQTYDVTGAYIYELLDESGLTPDQAHYGLASSSGVLNAAGLAVEQYVKAQPAVTIGLVFDTGTSSIDHITSSAIIGGTANPLVIVQFTLNGQAVAPTATADANGNWTIDATILADGQYTVVASVTGSGGATATSSLTFTLDTHASVPSVTSVVQSSNVATLAGSTGGSAGETVSIYDGGSLVGTTTTSAGGSFTATASASSLLTHVYSVTATDIAGNVGTMAGKVYLGSSGSDVIIGSTAADLIQGGGGADTLTGGGGQDTFVYRAVSDSTSSAPDTITDYVHGVDKIDFTSIAGINATGGVAQFQGGGVITGSVSLNAHSVGFIQTGASTIVLVNTSNTGEVVSATNTHAADMEIVLVGVNLVLNASDFRHS